MYILLAAKEESSKARGDLLPELNRQQTYRDRSVQATDDSFLLTVRLPASRVIHQCIQNSVQTHFKNLLAWLLKKQSMSAYSSSSSRSSSRSSIASSQRYATSRNLVRHSAPAVKQCPDTVQQLLHQPVTNKLITTASATPFGSRTNGVICLHLPTFAYICLQFPRATDKHAAFTASQENGAEHIHPNLYLTTMQQEQPLNVSLNDKQLKQESFGMEWSLLRGGW